MAVRNGARFLPEQLDSLRDQAGPPLALLWRDDGSQDGSGGIIADWAACNGAAARQVEQPAGRLGAARGFLALLAAAPDDAAFFAFCDQDDVWLPDKTARAVAALAAVPAGLPALACARQRLVDATLRPLGDSTLPSRPPGFGNAIVQNIATGCTIVLNPAARALLLAAPPPPAGSMHDWWAYILVPAPAAACCSIPSRRCCIASTAPTRSAPTRRCPPAAPGAAPRPARLHRHGRRASRQPGRGRAAAGGGGQARAGLLRGMRGRGPLGRLRLARQAGLYRQSRVQDLAMAVWFALAPMPPAEAAAP